MRKKMIFLFIGLIFIVAGCYIVPVQEEQPAQVLEWKLVTVRATGSGAPPARAVNAAQARLMAERAAKLDCYRNLLEETYGINISARSNVRNFILKNDSIKARVDAYVRGAKVVHTTYHDDGGVEVEMQLTLRQDFRQIFP